MARSNICLSQLFRDTCLRRVFKRAARDQGLAPEDGAKVSNVDRKFRLGAEEALGDISGAALHQLVTLYDACEAATYVWSGAYNIPRLGYEGDTERPHDIADEEMARLWHMQEHLIAELRRCLMPDPRDEGERARVLVDWYWKGDHEPAIYADAMRSLSSAMPHVKR